MNILSRGKSKRGGRHEYQDKIWDKGSGNDAIATKITNPLC